MAAGSQSTNRKGQASGNGAKKRPAGQKPEAARSRSETARKQTAKRSAELEQEEELQEESIWHRYQDEMILMLVLVLSVLLLLSNFHLCGPAGDFINQVAFGLFGFLAYLFPVLLFFGTAFYLSNKHNRSVVHKLICMVFLFFLLGALLQLVTYGSSSELKIKDLYLMSAGGRDGGGFLGGGLAKLLCSVIDVVGAYIVLIGAVLVLLMFITEKFLFSFLGSKYKEQQRARRIRREQREQTEQETWLEETALAREEPPEEAEEEYGGVGRRAGRRASHEQSGIRQDSSKVYSLEEQKKKRRKAKSYTFPLEEEKHTDSVEMQELKLQNLVIQRGGETEVIDVSPYYEEELKKKFGGQAETSTQNSANQKQTNQKQTNQNLTNQNPVNEKPANQNLANEKPEPETKSNEPSTARQREYAGSGSSLLKASSHSDSVTEKTKAAEPSSEEGLLSWDMLDKNLDRLEVASEAEPEVLSSSKRFSPLKVVPSQEAVQKPEASQKTYSPKEAREEEKERILKAKSIEGNRPLDSYVKTSPVENASLQNASMQNGHESFLRRISPSDASQAAEAEPVRNEAVEIKPRDSQSVPAEIKSESNLAAAEIRSEGNPVAAEIKQEESQTAAESEAEAVSAREFLQKQSEKPEESERRGQPEQTEKPEPTAPVETAKTVEASPAVSIPAIQPSPEPYRFPSLELLNEPPKDQRGASNEELQETAITLQKTLESFGVRVTVTNVSCGPAVTRYELQPERGVKVSRITGLTDDIKLNLAAEDIRIEAPIPGKAAVGIEVPNKENATVFLRELLETDVFSEHKSSVAFAVGKDIGGQTIVTDIAKMPHLLIAGATGSGKSVCINTLIMSVLYKADPNDVKLIMIDPKVVELSVYNGIPHLLIPVVTDPKKASGALNWAVMEMMDRYQRFADVGVREVKGYNEKIASAAQYREDPRYVKMPQIVIIVDELADLMMVAPGEVEDAICRLAQLARAAGIHLVIATQRPSVNVITGLIKANIPSRIAFAVSSAIDSRTILDGAGAEKLLGKGDMLFFPTGYPKPVRVQGAFVSDQEVTAVVDYLREQNSSAGYNAEIIKRVDNAQPSPGATGGDAAYGNGNGQDEYFAEAGKFIIEKDKASIGMLQRVYKIGFNRAARIMDQLSEAGVVGPEEGTKPRKVLMSLEEFENYLEQN